MRAWQRRRLCDAFGHKQLQGTATYLANFLAAECGCKTRAVELSTLQRSASHMASRVDIDEAFMVGGAAVKAADEGDTGKMVVIDRVSDDPYMSATGIYDVHRIANEEKLRSPFLDEQRGQQCDKRFRGLYQAADPGRLSAYYGKRSAKTSGAENEEKVGNYVKTSKNLLDYHWSYVKIILCRQTLPAPWKIYYEQYVF